MNYKEIDNNIQLNNIYIGFNNFLTSHDFSVTVIQNNKVKAIELERINRLKYSPEEIEIGNVELGISNKNTKIYFENALNYILSGLKIIDFTNVYLVNAPFEIDSFNDKNITIRYYKCLEHHFAHACSSYYPSEFNNSAIISLDWVGRDSNLNMLLTQSIWLGEGNAVKFVEGNEYNRHKNGIGMVYSLFSDVIGLGEGAIMGLAGYGNTNIFNGINLYDYTEKEVFLSNLFLDDTDLIKSDYKCLLADEAFRNKIIINIKNKFGINQKHYKEKDITKSIFADLAAKLQNDTEKAVVFLANRAYSLTKSKNLCLAGGVALNVLANTRILKETPFENIFVQPAAKDSGLSLGLAYYAYHILGKQQKRIPLTSPGIGNEYGNQILESLDKYNEYIEFTYEENISKIVAEKLAQNKIIGWFAGGSEFGPRALGFRSILASPISIEMKDRVNDIKNRQKWRPLAPILLEEDLGYYFEDSISNGYMTFVGNIKNDKLDKIPSVVHIDGTARYQTVNIKQNSKIYKLIGEFKKVTGESVLINTSLNVAKEPIVEIPEDAIKIFLSTDIDYLVLENYIITKKEKVNKFKYNVEENLNYNMGLISFNEKEFNRNKVEEKYMNLIKIFFRNINSYIVDILFTKNKVTFFYSSNIIISIFINISGSIKYDFKYGKIACCYSYKKGYNKEKCSEIIDIFSNSIRLNNDNIYRFLKSVI